MFLLYQSVLINKADSANFQITNYNKYVYIYIYINIVVQK